MKNTFLIQADTSPDAEMIDTLLFFKNVFVKAKIKQFVEETADEQNEWFTLVFILLCV